KVFAMTTLQKIIVITVLTAAITGAVYEARQVSEKVAAEAVLAEQMQHLELEYKNATNELTSLRLRREDGAAVEGSPAAEVLKLRGEIAALRRLVDESKQSDSANQSEFKWTIGTIIGLKRKLREMPEKNVPEIQYLDDDKWLRIVLGPGMS